MKRVILGLGLSLAVLFFLPADGFAQVKGHGFFIGGGLDATVYSPDAIEDFDEDSDTESGAGINAYAGFGFGFIAPYARLGYAIMSADDDEDTSDNPTLMHLDIGARLSLPLGPVVPYANAAYTIQRLSQDYADQTFTASGNGFTGGVGVEFFLGDNLALDGALNVTSGQFTKVSLGDQEQDLDPASDNTTYRLDVGLVFYTGSSQQ